MTESGIQWRRTSPVAIVFFILRFARQLVTNGLPAIAVLATLAAQASDELRGVMISALAVLLLVSVVGAVLSWLRFRYCVVDDRVLLHSGVLHHEELSVDFNRVQNIAVREPFYVRPFGLALLSIDTAGSAKKEIVLGGIPKQEALALRQIILAKRQDASVVESNVSPQESSEPEDGTLLLSRSSRDIIIYGLTINFLLWLAIAVGAFFGATDISESVFQWLASKIRLEDILTALNTDGTMLMTGLMIVIALLALVLLLPLLSVIGALFRHYGYQLHKEGETYRKTSGLLNRHDESMKQHKIQAMVLKQNVVARWFNRTNLQLRVASAGSGLEQGQLPATPQSKFIVPALRADEVTKLSAEFLPQCDIQGLSFSAINRKYFVYKVLLLGCLPPIGAISIGPAVLFGWKILLLTLVLLTIAWWVVNRVSGQYGYSVMGEYGFIRSGFLGTTVTVFPLFKVQRVDLVQTPGQRRHQLASLTIHLASHSVTVPYMPVEDAQLLRDLSMLHVETSQKAWY